MLINRHTPVRALNRVTNNWTFAVLSGHDVRSDEADYFRVDPPAGQHPSDFDIYAVKIISRQGSSENFKVLKRIHLPGVLS